MHDESRGNQIADGLPDHGSATEGRGNRGATGFRDAIGKHRSDRGHHHIETYQRHTVGNADANPGRRQTDDEET
ncbi:Uncharacterised protein [Chlamydia trachomatis]|nr:Uncharacterised protein [Chlamydia trachomatis]